MTFNGRHIDLKAILEESAMPQSRYEASAFEFIKKWFSKEDSFIQQTSGSTSAPKSISISRKSMIASALLTQQALQLKRNDTALVCLDPGYIAGKMMFVRAFVIGMKVVMIDPTMNPFSKLPENVQVDFIALVPAQLSDVLQSEDRARLNKIKNVLVGGAPINEGTAKLTSDLDARIYATYGMTETVSQIALQPLNGPSASDYFKVLPGIKINTDDRGCLVISAPYLGEKIVTNDVVEIKSASAFKWLGRSDNVVNSGGVKIFPEVVEAKIHIIFNSLQIPNRFFLCGIPDPAFGTKLALVIEGNLPTTVERLHSVLKQTLPQFHIPKQIFVDVHFEMTENGKVNRQETVRRIGI
jgi:O-succinylbenzoic acid--CoA ligase